MFCNVKPDCVIENITLPNLYEAPLMLEKSGFSSVVCRELGIEAPAPELTEWTTMVERIKARPHYVDIGLVGKYVGLHDAYLSVAEALLHAGYFHNTHIRIHWMDSGEITVDTVEEKLAGLDGILVPGGFGTRHRRYDSGSGVCKGERNSIFRHLSWYADRRYRICEKMFSA